MAREAREYKVIIVTESGVGTILTGASKLPLQKLEAELNRWGREGWNMDFMVLEQQRYMLFWTREAAVITLSRAIA